MRRRATLFGCLAQESLRQAPYRLHLARKPKRLRVGGVGGATKRKRGHGSGRRRRGETPRADWPQAEGGG
eukprot:9199667-Alexandrium_andersonii.AAC.1